jgi:hypothetical protein
MVKQKKLPACLPEQLELISIHKAVPLSILFSGSSLISSRGIVKISNKFNGKIKETACMPPLLA